MTLTHNTFVRATVTVGVNHPTPTVISSVIDARVVVLVGPPASGKTTVRNVMSDYGVVSCDLAQYHEDGELVNDGWQQTIDETLEEATESAPKLAVIEGAISDDEVGYIRESASGVLVVRVDAGDFRDLLDRYVDRELSTFYDKSEAVSEPTVEALRMEAVRRDHKERPYPQHDVRIVNDDDLSVAELTDRTANLIAVVSNVDRSELVSPRTVGASG